MQPQNWSNFGSYISAKRQKIEKQNDFPKYSDIFTGIVIYVNGYTVPSQQELREMICNHGGSFQFHLDSRITHIVSNNRPAGSRSSWNKNVIKPEWITRSIQQNKLLPIDEYFIPLNQSIKDDKNIKQTSITWQKRNEKEKEEHEEDEDVTDDDEVEHHEHRHPLANEEMLMNPNVKALTATDPNFLQNYYKSSRLHFLSTWKSELAEYAAKLFHAKKPLPPSTRPAANLPTSKIIMHIDMDCFFASIGLRDKPELVNEPIAICHSTNNESTSKNSYAEISSCNYVARSFGLYNGMPLKYAVEKCPNLQILPYEFEKYKEAALIIYKILVDVCDFIEPISCDEAYIEVTSKINNDSDAVQLANVIRAKIFQETQCTASIGIGENMLLARLATKKAKPNGVFQVTMENKIDFLKNQNISDLPGVGYSLSKQFDEMKMKTLSDLANVPLVELQETFGQKQGEKFYNFCRGIDNRQLKLTKPRKSIGSEISWGIRFNTHEEVIDFIRRFCEEISARMKNENVVGKMIHLKIMVPVDSSVKPKKFLGSGYTENSTKSTNLPKATNDSTVIFNTACRLLSQFSFEPNLLRGIGIQIQKLEPFKPNSTTVDIRDLMNRANQSSKLVEEKPENLEIFCKKYKYEFDTFNQLPVDFKIQLLQEHNCSHLIDLATMKQSDSIASEPVHLYSASQIDQSVLNDLPSDVREEVICSIFGITDSPIASTSASPKIIPRTPVWSPGADKRFKRSARSASSSPLSSSKKKLFNTPDGTGKISTQTLTQAWAILPDNQMKNADKEIFFNLPKDIRSEVIKDLKREAVKNRANKEDNGIKIFEKEHFKLLMSEDIVTEIKPLKAMKIEFFGRTERSDWIALLVDWMKVDIPSSEDVEYFKHFLIILIEHKMLEDLSVLLKFMKRQLEDRPFWVTVFNELTVSIQQHVLSHYNSYLSF